MLNLSKIPKEILFTTKHGDKAIFVDILEKKNGADQYGNTHTVTLYNKEKKETIYLGDLKEVEFGKDNAGSNAGGNAGSNAGGRTGNASDDLPF